MTDIHVILVDDDTSTREVLADYLHTEAGFQVTAYGGGDEALKDILSERTRYTAVLLDYVLAPPISGAWVLREIRKRYPNLPVVVFTGQDPEGGVSALERGAYRYLRRPIDYAELVSMVRSLADQDMVFHELAKDVRRMLECDMCIAWRLGRRDRRFTVAAWDGESQLEEEYRNTVTIDLDNPATRDFLETAEPIFLHDVTDPKSAPYYRHQKQATKHGWTSLISIPLVRQQRVIGLIDGYYCKLHTFASDQERNRWLDVILPAFANQAAEAVRNGELSRQSQAVQGINQILAGSYDEKTVIRQILAKSLELVGAEAGWLYLADLDKEELILKDWSGIPDEIIERERAIDEGITGWVAQEGQSLNVPDVTVDERHKKIIGVEILSELAVPLRREEETIGVLTVISPYATAFSDDDVNLLTILAAQATIAIGRASLGQYIPEVSRLAHIGEFTDLAEYVVQAARRLTGAEVILWRTTDSGDAAIQHFQIAAAAGKFSGDYIQTARLSIALGSSITALALERGEPVIRRNIRDVAEAPNEPSFYSDNLPEAEQHDWHSFMAAPLLGRTGERLGSLSLYSQEIAKFGKPETDLMRYFADQVATAIDDNQLLKKLQQQTQTLSDLYRAGQLLTQAPDLETVMVGIVHQAQEILAADSVVLYRYDTKQDDIMMPPVLAGVRDPKTLQETGEFHKDSVALTLVRSGQPVYATRSRQHRLLSNPNRPQAAVPSFVEREEIESTAAVVLRAMEEIVGILFVNYRTSRGFDAQERKKIELFGIQAAIAIQNALRLEQERKLREQADTLRMISETISSARLNLNQLADSILEELSRVVPYRTASFQLIEGDLRTQIALRGPEAGTPPPWLHLPIDFDPLINRILREKQACILPDVSQSPAWKTHQITAGVHSWIGLPLVYNNETIGLVTFDHNVPGFYKDELRSLLSSVGNQAAIAIKRAQLLDDLQDQLTKHKAVNALAIRLSGLLSEIEVLDGVVEVVATTLACPVSVIYGYEDGKLAIRCIEKSRKIDDDLSQSPDPIPGVVDWVARHGRSALVPNTFAQDAKQYGAKPYLDPASILAVPVFLGGDVYCIISVMHDELNRFDENDRLFLETSALLAGQAITNVQLVAELRQSLKQLAIQTKIYEKIVATGVRDLDSIWWLLYETAHEVMELRDSQVQIAFIDENRDEVSFPLAVEIDNGNVIDIVRWGIRDEEYRDRGENEDVSHFKSRPRGSRFGLTEYVINTKKRTLISDNFFNKASSLEVDGERVQVWPTFGRLDRPTKSWLGVPMVVNGKVIGCLSIQSLEAEHAVDENQSELVTTMANQAAVAIQNSILYSALESRLSNITDLQQLSLEMATELGLDKLLGIICQLTRQLLNADFVTIFLYNQIEGRLFKAMRLSDDLAQPSLPSTEGLAMEIVRDGLEVFEEDVQKWDRIKKEFARKTRLVATAGLPIQYSDQPTGVLFVNYQNRHRFDEWERHLLRTIASQAAVAIENSRLYGDLKQAYETLKQAQEQKVWAELGKTAGSLAHRIGNKGGIVRVCSTDIADRLQDLGIADDVLNTKLTMIQRNVDYLLEMSDLLFMPVEAAKAELEKTDLALVMADAISFVDIPEDVKIKVLDELSGLPQVPANSYFVEVFVELISNAVSAMKSSKEKVLTISGRIKGSNLEIRFSDTGPGIPPNKQKALFDIFTRFSDEDLPVSEHRGFGLWWVKSFLVNIGGEISIEADPAKGTSFIVMIPLESHYA